MNTNLSVIGSETISGGLAVGSNAVVSGTATIGTQLTVLGASTLVGNVYLQNNASVSGSANIGSNINVVGTIVGTALQISGPFASVSGNVAAGSSLFVGQSASISGAASISGVLLVNNTGSFANNVAIGTGLYVGGAASVTGNINAAMNANVGSNLTVGNSASITNNITAGGTISSQYGSFTGLTAGNAIVMNSLVVEGASNFISSIVSTYEDLNLQLGLNQSRRVSAVSAGTVTAASGGDTASQWTAGVYAVITGQDHFSTGTLTGYEPVLQCTYATLTSVGSYLLCFNRVDVSTATQINYLTDLGFPTGYDLSANVVYAAQISTGALYGKAGLTFNSYSSISGQGMVTNSTRNCLFDNDTFLLSRSDAEVVDLNLSRDDQGGEPLESILQDKQLECPEPLHTDPKHTRYSRHGWWKSI